MNDPVRIVDAKSTRNKEPASGPVNSGQDNPLDQLSVPAGEFLAPQREVGPLNLVFVRHGYSERNAAARLRGAKLISEELFQKVRQSPDNQARLMKEGREQAEAAGRWLKEHLGFTPDIAFCSHFVRAVETAGIIGRELSLSTRWRKDSKFGERWWGEFDYLSEEDRAKEYIERKNNARYWTPPGGESMRLLEICARSALGGLYRGYADKNVLIVTHGELIMAMRSGLERLPDQKLNEVVAEGVPNCGIVHYTRVDPETGETGRFYDHVRLVNPTGQPWKGEGWDGEWQRIVRPTWDSEDLLKEVEKYPRLLADQD